MPAGTGPYKVITNLAVLGFDESSCRMRIESLHEGITQEQVQECTGFDLLVRDPLEVTPPPTADQLAVLRTEVDPQGYILGRRGKAESP